MKRPTWARAGLTGAALGAWLGMLTGLIMGVSVAGVAWPLALLGGLLIGAAAGAVLGLVVHGATDGRRDVASGPPARRTAGATEVERAALPGLGLSYSLATAAGHRVGVVAHRSGRRDLVSYDAADPDHVRHSVPLTAAEARTVAELLGFPVFVDQVK